MARTPLVNRFQRLYKDFALEEKTGTPVADIQAERQVPPTRRQFLKIAAAGTIGALAWPKARLFARAAPRVAIVGGGIAGLNAALTLADAGLASTVYEASSRIGGRMHSDTTSWLNGQTSEHCGELIDSGHETILGLAQRFQIPVADLLAAQPAGTTDTNFFGGGYYTVQQVNEDFGPVYKAVKKDAVSAGYPTLYNDYKGAGLALDHMSVYDWIESRVPGGHASRMGQLLDIAYTIEYGADTTVQSALNLIYLLAYQPSPKEFAAFGESDERYHLIGGNERLPQAIAAALPAGTVRLGTSLTGIERNSDGTFTLRFKRPAKDVVADHVILAIPFSVLRTLDYSRAGFSGLKTLAIQTLGAGANAKLQLQFETRLWNQSGPWGRSTGSSYGDTGYQNTWEVTRAQPGSTGILVNYTGGSIAAQFANYNNAQAVHNYATALLAQLEPVFPGITGRWTGRATLDTPFTNPYLLGSYSYWKVGQYTSFAGVEKERSGNCHFAGEHCSQDFQGFMEGGAAEGARAAMEIVAEMD
jgi:monoamine oxidase